MEDMDDIVELPADFDFERATRAIVGEEAWGYVFKDGRIGHRDGEAYNEIGFVFHPEGNYPSPCILLPASAAAPSGCAKQWQGQLLVDSRVRNVVLYRRP
jgi:hypothetical protein